MKDSNKTVSGWPMARAFRVRGCGGPAEDLCPPAMSVSIGVILEVKSAGAIPKTRAAAREARKA